MRARAPVAAAAVVLGACLAAAQAAAQSAPAPERRWSVEAVGGAALIAPGDLNGFSSSRDATYSAYYEALFRYYESIYQQNFTSSVAREGSFPRIGRGWTGGVRASYRISRRAAAVIAFQYLSQVRSASVQLGHDSTTINPNAVSFETTEAVTYRFAPLLLSARSYAPEVGVRWTFWRRGRTGLDAVGLGGVAWGSCRVEEDFSTATTFYRTRSSTTTRMRGSGWSAAGEAAIRANWDLASRWRVFLEAGYHLQRLGRIEGSLEQASTTQDGDAVSPERESESSVAGRWRMVPGGFSSPVLGTVSRSYPSIGTDQGRAFVLDLSGVRLQVGVALRF